MHSIFRALFSTSVGPGLRRGEGDDPCTAGCPIQCGETCPLLSVSRDTHARIVQLDCPYVDACRLRTLGVFEGASVRVVDRRHGILLDVRGSRLALDRRVAMTIMVSPIN